LSISRLIGAEPGYVGYSDRSGLLSKAAEDNPHSVLYFRNIDLAHAIVQQFLGELSSKVGSPMRPRKDLAFEHDGCDVAFFRISRPRSIAHGFVPGGESEDRRLTGDLRGLVVSPPERGAGFGITNRLRQRLTR